MSKHRFLIIVTLLSFLLLFSPIKIFAGEVFLDEDFEQWDVDTRLNDLTDIDNIFEWVYPGTTHYAKVDNDNGNKIGRFTYAGDPRYQAGKIRTVDWNLDNKIYTGKFRVNSSHNCSDPMMMRFDYWYDDGIEREYSLGQFTYYTLDNETYQTRVYTNSWYNYAVLNQNIWYDLSVELVYDDENDDHYIKFKVDDGVWSDTLTHKILYNESIKVLNALYKNADGSVSINQMTIMSGSNDACSHSLDDMLLGGDPALKNCGDWETWNTCNSAGCCWYWSEILQKGSCDVCDYPDLCDSTPSGCQWCDETACGDEASCYWDTEWDICNYGTGACGPNELRFCDDETDCLVAGGYWDDDTDYCFAMGPPEDPAWTDPDFGFLGNYIFGILKYVFMPDFEQVKSRFLYIFSYTSSKFPFGYIKSAVTAMTPLVDKEAIEFPADITTEFFNTEVTIFSYSFFEDEDIAPLFSTFRTLIVFYLWFVAFDYIIFRVKSSNVGV